MNKMVHFLIWHIFGLLAPPAPEIQNFAVSCSSGSAPNDEQDEAADYDARVDVEELVAVAVRWRIVNNYTIV